LQSTFFFKQKLRLFVYSFLQFLAAMAIADTINKLAVTSEPGLTNAQLMLTNHDLRPGEPVGNNPTHPF
jgi:hypothetical protein